MYRAHSSYIGAWAGVDAASYDVILASGEDDPQSPRFECLRLP